MRVRWFGRGYASRESERGTRKGVQESERGARKGVQESGASADEESLQMTWGEWIRSPEAIRKSVVHEARHYYHGFKLLCLNVGSAAKILSRLLQSQHITRRERELLVRTTSDLFRMVPFMVILVVPFMELALPFILKFFPNMLPSTFDKSQQKKDEIKKQLVLKIETAKFLHEMLEEIHSEVVTNSPELKEFLEKLRTGSGVEIDEFVKYAKIFRDEVTLRSLQHRQLTAMCRLLNIKPFGNDAILRMRLKSRVESLKKDDQYILDEDINSLSLEELQRAVSARGMYSHTKNKRALRSRLQSWLDLSVNKNVPITLLILSRALTLTSRTTIEQTLSQCISHLPPEVIDELEVRLGVSALGRKADASFKLELLEEYSKLIEEEHRQVSNAQLSPDERRDNLVALANLANPVGLESLQIEELQTTLSSLEKELSVHVSQVDDELKELEAELDSAKAEAYRRLLSERSAGGRDSSAYQTDEEFEREWEERKKNATSKCLETQKKRNLELKHLHKLKNRVNDLVGELSADAAVAQKELNTFKLLDQNDDGLISEDEVKFALVSLPQPLTEDQVRRVLDQLDIDHDGLIEVRHLIDVAGKFDIQLDEAAVQEYKKRSSSQKTDDKKTEEKKKRTLSV